MHTCDGDSQLVLTLAPLPMATKAKGLSLDLQGDEQLGSFSRSQVRTQACEDAASLT